MPRRETHVTCECGRISIFPIDTIDPFTEHKLRCSSCGRKGPKVEDVEVLVPFDPCYRSDVRNVRVLPRRK